MVGVMLTSTMKRCGTVAMGVMVAFDAYKAQPIRARMGDKRAQIA